MLGFTSDFFWTYFFRYGNNSVRIVILIIFHRGKHSKKHRQAVEVEIDLLPTFFLLMSTKFSLNILTNTKTMNIISKFE